MTRAPLIVLLTDYGIADPFTGILKGVLAGLAPGIPVVDLTHEIPAGDVRRGAITLWQAEPYFPDGSVFLCVIDPGVGTSRRAIMVESSSKRFVGPDNGLFTFVLKPEFQAWELSNPAYALQNPSLTFHGRDLFAPAAARAALGAPGFKFGASISDLLWLGRPTLVMGRAGQLIGEILYSDHYGNLLTSLGTFTDVKEGFLAFKSWLGGLEEKIYPVDSLKLVLPNGQKLDRADTFTEIPAGKCAFLIGSSGLLEIAANRLSAEQLLGLHGGEIVHLEIS